MGAGAGGGGYSRKREAKKASRGSGTEASMPEPSTKMTDCMHIVLICLTTSLSELHKADSRIFLHKRQMNCGLKGGWGDCFLL